LKEKDSKHENCTTINCSLLFLFTNSVIKFFQKAHLLLPFKTWLALKKNYRNEIIGYRVATENEIDILYDQRIDVIQF
jgi:hypothetical protein